MSQQNFIKQIKVFSVILEMKRNNIFHSGINMVSLKQSAATHTFTVPNNFFMRNLTDTLLMYLDHISCKELIHWVSNEVCYMHYL